MSLKPIEKEVLVHALTLFGKIADQDLIIATKRKDRASIVTNQATINVTGEILKKLEGEK